MRRVLWAAALVLLVSGAALKLTCRWREESADRRLTILVEYSEVQETALRQAMSVEDLLKRLHDAGANALLLSPSSIQDYLWQNMTFSTRTQAEAIRRQMEARGIVGVTLESEGRRIHLRRTAQSWDALKETELGFNPELMHQASLAGLRLVLRVNHDPWLAKDAMFSDLLEFSSAQDTIGLVFNTDEIPGGPEALPLWRYFLDNRRFVELLFEFHPTKAALKLAAQHPEITYRAHTIPSAELKDMNSIKESSRWRRAVSERSCRFLLFHVSPGDTFATYLENIFSMRKYFLRHGWEIDWPQARPAGTFATFAERHLAPLMALVVAILAPIAALRFGMSTARPWKSFFFITGLTLVGACIMAALADNPLSRLEITPFRGVKLAFALGWAGSFGVLYTWHEVKAQLTQNIRRIDVLVGLFLLAVVSYFLIRTGNAGSNWTAPWEQVFRERLEDLLLVRPRFKEFVVGYPLLILGLHTQRERIGRLLVGIGMIGPVSMVNTFCHLHSPLYLAFWRSANGILLGSLIGMTLVALRKCRS